MILNTNTDLMIMNPMTGDINYFNDTPEVLRNVNKEGYNVYLILNDFESKRTSNELIWLKWFWIDLDMQDSDVPTPYQWQLNDILDFCKKKLWFLPTKINRTFKWFHLFFKLSDELYSLDSEQYVNSYKYINKILWGDPKMKDVTAILKVDGFIDNKEGRKWFVIKNEYFNNENIVSVENIKSILWCVAKFDTKRIELFQLKTIKRGRNNNMFEEIDCLDFINAINNNNDAFKDIHIEVNGSDIDDTSGLKVYNDNWIHRIKDFSGKNRFGNRLFLYNYVIKEVMWITDFKVAKKTKFKDDNEKKEYDLKVKGIEKIGKIMGFLSNEFGIKYNKGLDEKPIVDSFMLFNLENKTFDIINPEDKLDMEVMTKFNNYIMKDIKVWDDLMRVATALNYFCHQNWLDIKRKFEIKENELLSLIWLSNKTENRKNLRILLKLLSVLEIWNKIEKIEEWKLKGYIRKTGVGLFNFSILERHNFETLYEIKSNFNVVKKNWINESLILENKFLFLSRVKENISNFGKYQYSLDRTMEFTWLTSKDWVKKLLLWYKKKWIIKDYSIKQWERTDFIVTIQ